MNLQNKHSVLYSSDTDNSTQLLLPHNHLQHFNICLLMAHLPMVKVIDLRDNDPLLCVDLARQRAPHDWLFSLTVEIQPAAHPAANRTETGPAHANEIPVQKRGVKHPSSTTHISIRNSIVHSNKLTIGLNRVKIIIIALKFNPVINQKVNHP